MRTVHRSFRLSGLGCDGMSRVQGACRSRSASWNSERRESVSAGYRLGDLLRGSDAAIIATVPAGR